MGDTVAGGAREAAPGSLRLVQDFLNTADFDAGEDRLGTAAHAGAWLHEHGVTGATRMTERDRARLLAVREALRALVSAHGGDPVAPAALSLLDEQLGTVPLHARIGADGVRLLPAGTGVERVLASLASAVVQANLDGTWARLKTCRDDCCRWAFYDRSKNATGAWCSMRSCGSRAKARAYRSRLRAGAVAAVRGARSLRDRARA